jgi:transposase
VSHPTSGRAGACSGIDPCSRCDLLLGLGGIHVEQVEREDGLLTVIVSTPVEPTGCPECGVIAVGRGRHRRVLHNVPGASRVEVIWWQRVWRCTDAHCSKKTFVEQLPSLVPARGSITTRAIIWAIGQLRREHATIAGLARQLGTSWKTVWRAIEPELQRFADDESRFENVTTLGVDEHIWHHVDPSRRGSKELTGMVDLTRDKDGKTRAMLLDLVPGRSGKAYKDWLHARGEAFRTQVQIAALDPFAGYKRAIDDKLEDATAVLDAFHVVKLSTAAVDEVRRRVQQDMLGHRGRKGDPLYGIQSILRAGEKNLTDKQRTRLVTAIEVNPDHDEVFIAWQAAQQLRSAYRAKDLGEGLRTTEKIVDSFPSCPIPEIARLGHTLKR